MRYQTYFAAAFLLTFVGCTKFEDAEITERTTFVHFFSSATNYVGITAEQDADGGFILSGEIRHEDGVSDALIIKTDARGHKIWEQVIPNSIINDIKPVGNGYILVGDSIQLNTGSLDLEVSELENTYARLLLMDAQGNILGQHITSGTVRRLINDESVTLTIDYHGRAFEVDKATNTIVVLGSFRVPGEKEGTFVSGFSPADISDSLWYQPFRSLDDDLFACNSLYITPGSDLVWASKTFRQEQNLSREYLAVSRVESNSTIKYYSSFGESDARNHSVEDLRKSGVGYCAVGTYAETNGLNANIFFVRFDLNLDLVDGSARYIDGEQLMLTDTLRDSQSKTSSSSFDEGLAITGTDDGFVLAGTMTSTPSVGNGGKDLLLVKLNGTGDKVVWKKLIGGSGDETVSSIRETQDNGLLICGTNTINGLSTIMLIKTDRWGNLDR